MRQFYPFINTVDGYSFQLLHVPVCILFICVYRHTATQSLETTQTM